MHFRQLPPDKRSPRGLAFQQLHPRNAFRDLQNAIPKTASFFRVLFPLGRDNCRALHRPSRFAEGRSVV